VVKEDLEEKVEAQEVVDQLEAQDLVVKEDL